MELNCYLCPFSGHAFVLTLTFTGEELLAQGNPPELQNVIAYCSSNGPLCFFSPRDPRLCLCFSAHKVSSLQFGIGLGNLSCNFFKKMYLLCFYSLDLHFLSPSSPLLLRNSCLFSWIKAEEFGHHQPTTCCLEQTLCRSPAISSFCKKTKKKQKKLTEKMLHLFDRRAPPTDPSKNDRLSLFLEAR